MGKPTTGGTQALDRAVALVAAVIESGEPVSFGELLAATGLAKSTASRMLAALERGGLLDRDEAGGYVAGSLFWMYASRHEPWEQLVRLARPVMERVSEDTQESVHLSVLRRDKVVQVAQVESRYLLGARDWTQIDVPAHTSALGKVFLAWGLLELPESQLERLTPRTVTTRAGLARDGAESRARGYTVTVDELEEGLSGVGVPLRSARGDVVGALGISGPTSRLTERVDGVGRYLISRAAEVAIGPHGSSTPTNDMAEKGVA